MWQGNLYHKVDVCCLVHKQEEMPVRILIGRNGVLLLSIRMWNKMVLNYGIDVTPCFEPTERPLQKMSDLIALK